MNMLEDSSQTFIWSYQSNSNPWSKQEPEEWTNYSEEINLVIEKNFRRKNTEADIGHYIIDFKNLIQVNKTDHKKIRKIKRTVLEIVPGELSWEWQSNKNAWGPNQKEEWTSYGPLLSQKIESEIKASKKIIDIGKYYISLKNMVQINKEDESKQRKVRRIFRESLPKLRLTKSNRFTGELPKIRTINDPIGDLYQILELFKNKFGAASCDEIVKGILKEADKLGEKHNDDANNILAQLQGLNAKCRVNELQWLDDKNRIDYQKQILKAYTAESFLYKRVNKLLREEDWEKMKLLAPYIIACISCFKSLHYHAGIDKEFLNHIDYEEDFDVVLESGVYDHPMMIELREMNQKSTILYRGAKLTKEMLNDYNPKTRKYFSWNAFTSTTRCKDIALSFCSDFEQGKYSTLFVIELVPKSSPNFLPIWMFSEYPSEEEVLLAPGTLFEILSQQVDNNTVIVRLKILNDLNGISEANIPLLANIQRVDDEIQKKLSEGSDRFYISDLPGKQVLQLLQKYDLKNMRRLDFRNVWFTESFDTTISLPFQVLELEFLTIDKAGSDPLITVLLNPNIKTLVISDCNISSHVFHGLPFSQIITLKMSTCPSRSKLDDNILLTLAEVLPQTGIRNLSLYWDRPIDDTSKELFFFSLRKTKVENLIQQKLSMNSKSAAIFMESIVHMKVKMLYLELLVLGEKLDDATAEVLGQGLVQSDIQELSMEFNKNIIKYLPRSKLESLAFKSEGSFEDVLALLDIIPKCRIQALQLPATKRQDSDIFLQKVLKLSKISSLNNIWYWGFHDNHYDALRKVGIKEWNRSFGEYR